MKTEPLEHKPPRLGVFLLRKIYDDELFQDISGDMQEIFEDRISEKGRRRASMDYMIDAMLSVRNYDLRSKRRITQNNSIAMFKNYFKITIRNIAKNKVYATLNILGLALGMAACLFILQYVSYERSYDKFHANHPELYRVLYKVIRGGELNVDCAAAVPRVGPFMKEKMPEVIDYARAFPLSAVVTYDNIKFREDRMHIADPQLLQIFTFPLIAGDPKSVLTEPDQLVITESVAKKYFGEENPIGKVMKLDSWWSFNMEVVGVTEDVPDNSHFKYDFLISYETLNRETRNDDGVSNSESNWGWYDFNTYVLVKPGTDPIAFDRKFEEILYDERGEDFEKYDYKTEFPLQAITDIHLYSDLLQESEPEEQGDGNAVFFLTIVAFFILLIAWINYINLATARSVERAKEVGVRKTMGAYRKQLIYQFISESVFLNFFALILSLAIVIFGINYFNQLTGSRLSLAFLTDGTFWAVVGAMFVLGSTLSGLYPAFVLSSYRPVSVLKGNLKNGSGNLLRRILVVFQFAASVMLITGTLVVYNQLSHMTNIDLGFDMTQTLVVKGPDVFEVDSLFDSTNEAFKLSLKNRSEVLSVTSSSNVPGDEIFWTRGIRKKEQNRDQTKITYVAGIDYEYFPTYDIEFLAGRNYGKQFSTDTGAVILNKAAAEFIGFSTPEEAINQKVHFSGEEKTIVGVVANYNQMSVKTTVAPIVFQLYNGASYYTVKLGNDNYQAAFDMVQEKYDGYFPGNPFDYFFLDDFFNRQYEKDYHFSRVFTLFAGFAIFVACLGLFGLSSFIALQRTKEIGIRKAIGADIHNIVFLLSKEFIILVAIAYLIAWPVAYLIMDTWLNDFPVRVDIGVTVFLVSGLVVILIALITVGYKTITTARSNPVKALRYE